MGGIGESWTVNVWVVVWVVAAAGVCRGPWSVVRWWCATDGVCMLVCMPAKGRQLHVCVALVTVRTAGLVQ